MISKNYLNNLVVQLFLLHLLFHLFSVLPIILALYLNEGELSSLVTFALSTISSLLKPDKLPDVLEQFSLYSIKLYIGIVILIKSASSTRVPSISVEHFSNGAQVLNATCVIAPSATSAVSAPLLLLTAIFPERHASELSQRLDSIDFVKNVIGLGSEYLPFDSLPITYHFFVQILSFHWQKHLANLQSFASQLFIWLWHNFLKN